MQYWKTLKSEDDAAFDKEVHFDAADIEPMITYGTNPGYGYGHYAAYSYNGWNE
mgnify:FL=1